MSSIRRVAPQELSDEMQDLWRSIVYEWELEEHHEETLKQALFCLDRANEARKVLNDQGLTIRDRFNQVKPHPLLRVERLNRLAYARLLRELGLDLTDPDTRPPRVGGGQY